MEEEPDLQTMASVIPEFSEPMECGDDTNKLFQSYDAVFQQSGSPSSSTSDAAAVPGDKSHSSELDPGHPEAKSQRNGKDELSTVQSIEALPDGGTGMEQQVQVQSAAAGLTFDA